MTRPTNPYAARCRELAASASPDARHVYLGALRSIEGGGVSGPIALLSALVELGVDPEDADCCPVATRPQETP